jgi:hypothetical protein
VTGPVLDIWRCCAEDFPSFLACPPSSTVGMLPAGSRRLQVFRSHRHENMGFLKMVRNAYINIIYIYDTYVYIIHMYTLYIHTYIYIIDDWMRSKEDGA